jgi:NADPH:quinone reductase-like Zn-dependent oxidoreductase
MKAVVQIKYGAPEEALTVREIDKPVPGDCDVLVKVRAASMHADVWHVVAGLPYLLRLFGGLRKPKSQVPGTDLAGVVESVGAKVTRFKVGDEVFGESVKFGWVNGGSYAEYAAVPESFLALKPGNITFEQAAAIPSAGTIALNNLRSSSKVGQHVAINGAGGAMGTLAIQIAKAQGARVTAVDCAEKLAMMKALGADRVVDYTRENYLDCIDRYDLIIDVPLVLPRKQYQHALTLTGRYVPIGHAHYGRAKRFNGRLFGSLPHFIGRLIVALANPKTRKEIKFRSKLEILSDLKALVESGKLSPVIAKTYSLDEVPAAIRDMQEGKTLGRMIIVPSLNREI